MPIHTNGELAARYLTGRVRGRPGWFGRVIMQVEVCSPRPRYPKPPRRPPYDAWSEGAYTFWRDATAADLTAGGCTARGSTPPTATL